MMSDEEPLPEGKIGRKRPSWRADSFNELMDTLDLRATSSFQRSARKERVPLSPIKTAPPSNIKDWMVSVLLHYVLYHGLTYYCTFTAMLYLLLYLSAL